MLTFEDERGQTRWKYGPFLTASLVASSPKHFVRLPSETEVETMEGKFWPQQR